MGRDIRTALVTLVNSVIRELLESREAYSGPQYIEVADDSFVSVDRAMPEQWEAAQQRLERQTLDDVEKGLNELIAFCVTRSILTANRRPRLVRLRPGGGNADEDSE